MTLTENSLLPKSTSSMSTKSPLQAEIQHFFLAKTRTKIPLRMHENTPFQANNSFLERRSSPLPRPFHWWGGYHLPTPHPSPPRPIKPSGSASASPQNSSQIYATAANDIWPSWTLFLECYLLIGTDQYYLVNANVFVLYVVHCNAANACVIFCLLSHKCVCHLCNKRITYLFITLLLLNDSAISPIKNCVAQKRQAVSSEQSSFCLLVSPLVFGFGAVH